ncbi:MAG: hypothetical protein ACK4SY_07230 [Pyrobaculum sp.]
MSDAWDGVVTGPRGADTDDQMADWCLVCLAARAWVGEIDVETFQHAVIRNLQKAGWAVEKEYVMDVDGYVYGWPDEVEYHVATREGRTYLFEISPIFRRGDVALLVRKRELFERIKGRQIERIYAVAPFILDKNPDWVKTFAERNNIYIIYDI